MKAKLLAELPVSFPLPRATYFASDLHLCDRSGADDFAEDCHEEAFGWFLREEVEEDGADLVLVGDVFELWQSGLAEIRRAYPLLFWRLHNYQLIRGNHDKDHLGRRYWLWPGPYRPAVLAEHGHEADPLNSTLDFIGRAVTGVAGLLERIGFRDIDKVRLRAPFSPTPVTKPSRFPPGHYQDYARRRARDTGAGLIILGHTHRPTLLDLGGGVVYGNCGCWVDDDYAGSFLRLGNGAISLCQICP